MLFFGKDRHLNDSTETLNDFEWRVQRWLVGVPMPKIPVVGTQYIIGVDEHNGEHVNILEPNKEAMLPYATDKDYYLVQLRCNCSLYSYSRRLKLPAAFNAIYCLDVGCQRCGSSIRSIVRIWDL